LFWSDLLLALLDKRLSFKDKEGQSEYPQADQFWTEQITAYWTHFAIPLDTDKKRDWPSLSESEQTVIAKTLKGFTQAEVVIGNYWASLVPKWFKKPEIQNMAYAFAGFESVHSQAYAALQLKLGLNDFEAFLQEPSAKAKIDRLVNTKGSKNVEDIARSLAVFSAFNEGVNLFSSFAILMSFSRRDLLKGIGQIIRYSIRDESLHSRAGCWLFRTLMSEYPTYWTETLKEQIYDAARLTVQLEDEFIDQAFSLGDIESISHKDLKAYIRFRTNTKLKDLGLTSIYKNINKESLSNMEWFAVLSAGDQLQDFFAGKVVDYSKSSADFGFIIEDSAWT
jgi:ribonucleoside-diphosphate reductase beta chain